MNFIDMVVTAAPDAFRLSADGIDLELPQRRFAGLGAQAGRTVTMGVRPQHLRLGPADAAEHVGLSGNLMVTEQLGDEQVLAVRIGKGDIRVAGVDPELALATGTRIDVAVPMDNLHLFDTASGAAIR